MTKTRNLEGGSSSGIRLMQFDRLHVEYLLLDDPCPGDETDVMHLEFFTGMAKTNKRLFVSECM